MGFERFTAPVRSAKLTVSIWSKGQIGFSKFITAKCELEKFPYVIFFYNKEERKIGFRFTSDENEAGARKLNIRKTGAVVGATAFLDYYEIDHQGSKKFLATFDAAEKMLVIKLEDGIKAK
jgi:hypothetical protein